MIGTGTPLSELGGLLFTAEDRLGELFLKARLGTAEVGLHQCPSEKQSQTKSGRSQLVPFSRPEPGPDRRQTRDFARHRLRDPAETDSAAEGDSAKYRWKI